MHWLPPPKSIASGLGRRFMPGRNRVENYGLNSFCIDNNFLLCSVRAQSELGNRKYSLYFPGLTGKLGRRQVRSRRPLRHKVKKTGPKMTLFDWHHVCTLNGYTPSTISIASPVYGSTAVHFAPASRGHLSQASPRPSPSVSSCIPPSIGRIGLKTFLQLS